MNFTRQTKQLFVLLISLATQMTFCSSENSIAQKKGSLLRSFSSPSINKLHDVLGVNKTATSDETKTAHKDLNIELDYSFEKTETVKTINGRAPDGLNFRPQIIESSINKMIQQTQEIMKFQHIQSSVHVLGGEGKTRNSGELYYDAKVANEFAKAVGILYLELGETRRELRQTRKESLKLSSEVQELKKVIQQPENKL